ncbi:Sec20-domain-containing protein [Blyttiomyces helicus]|uniref:Sec20-domain-containing protein n=1 Tax=Blyttiomyces helicus TaxID=388810 RepID=A0A4P9WJN3_9FUNG|nr:Sec20-domain-containing protein [Blyttiomyces helicus]|eukprot:RKO90856.1 Sec20-domain-containing protein [Blyttiomyces helicus]
MAPQPSQALPPLPQPIQRKLDSLLRRELQLEAVIADLRDCSGPASEVARLNAEVKEGLKTVIKGIEDLNDVAEEQDREADAEAIRARLDKHESQLQSSLRRANLSAKQNMDKAVLAEREELLSGGADRRAARMRKLHANEAVSQVSNELTSSLRDAVQMMNVEVERSAQAAKTLADSTRVLEQTGGEYRTFESVLKTSKQLVTKLQQRDWTDRLLLLFGLFVFLMSVFSVLKRRLWIWIPGWKWVSGGCEDEGWFCF